MVEGTDILAPHGYPYSYPRSNMGHTHHTGPIHKRTHGSQGHNYIDPLAHIGPHWDKPHWWNNGHNGPHGSLLDNGRPLGLRCSGCILHFRRIDFCMDLDLDFHIYRPKKRCIKELANEFGKDWEINHLLYERCNFRAHVKCEKL